MRHPFSLDLSDLETTQQEETLTQAEAEAVGGGRRHISWGAHEGGGRPIATTRALGEEGGGPIATTLALGEEGGGPIATTRAFGEEGGGPISIDIGKIDLSDLIESIKNPIDFGDIATTLALGEEGGGYFSH